MNRLNNYTDRKYKYEFFTFESLGTYVFINAGLFFGYRWYTSAVETKGDELNGILIMSFALCLFIYVLVKNIRYSNFIVGLIITIVQVIVYLPCSIIGFFSAIYILSYFAQTKPVYNIN